MIINQKKIDIAYEVNAKTVFNKNLRLSNLLNIQKINQKQQLVNIIIKTLKNLKQNITQIKKKNNIFFKKHNILKQLENYNEKVIKSNKFKINVIQEIRKRTKKYDKQKHIDFLKFAEKTKQHLKNKISIPKVTYQKLKGEFDRTKKVSIKYN